jgi:hypothetical protein
VVNGQVLYKEGKHTGNLAGPRAAQLLQAEPPQQRSDLTLSQKKGRFGGHFYYPRSRLAPD